MQNHRQQQSKQVKTYGLSKYGNKPFYLLQDTEFCFTLITKIEMMQVFTCASEDIILIINLSGCRGEGAVLRKHKYI